MQGFAVLNMMKAIAFAGGIQLSKQVGGMEDSAKHLPTALLTGTWSCSGTDADAAPSQMSPANEESRFMGDKKKNSRTVVTTWFQGSKLEIPHIREGENGGRRERLH